MTKTTRLCWSALHIVLCLGWTVKFIDCFSAVAPPSNNNHAKESSIIGDASVAALPTISIPANGAASQQELTNGASTKSDTKKAAVVLNTNARSVSTDLIPIAESIFGKEYVYVTTSEQEAQQAATKMTQQNISMIIPVGGDGTLSSMINFLCDAIPTKDIDEAMKELPLVGYIPLGTGNGVGSVVGSELLSNSLFTTKRRRLRQVEHTLRRFHNISQQLAAQDEYLSSPHAPDIVEIPMMQVSYPDDATKNAALCFFAGAGFDSLMLQDFQSIKKWAIRTKILKKTLSSVAGYCVALVLKTLPKCVTKGEHNIQVKLTTRDPDTVWVDHRRGDVVQQCTGELLFHGTTGILAAGTSPFYGGGLRLFPFARLTKDKMHLRLGRIHPLRGFLNIPKIFEGSYRDKRASSFGCLDFLGNDFDVQITSSTTDDDDAAVKGFPVQHSGESVGYFERFRLRVVQSPVRFVTLMEKRMVVQEEEK